jgi:co-chaperonin GroES (HSP10)
MFTALITTTDKYSSDEKIGGIINTKKTKGSLKEYQRVVAVGDSVRNINVGDVVMINPTRFAVKKHQEGSLKDGIITDNPVIEYRFDIVEMNGEQYLLLQDRDISYVIEDYEETEDKTSGIILPREKELIV